MQISFSDIFLNVVSAYRASRLLPSLKKKLAIILRPFDATRYLEFAYMEKFIRIKRLKGMNVLDVSSPHIMAYILSSNNKVLKTNIDKSEKMFIKENPNLNFRIEDATNLKLPDNTFDLVYSVSVIEHIYQSYRTTIKEMIRVAKPGGYIYLTFPVSRKYGEEWSDEAIYSDQHIKSGRHFFQYRFDSLHVQEILETIKQSKAVLAYEDIFWEGKNGRYDRMIRILNKRNSFLYPLKNILVNLYFGMFLFDRKGSKDFSIAKSFGNMHIIIQKNA